MPSKCPSSNEAQNGSAQSIRLDRVPTSQRLVNGTHQTGQQYQNGNTNEHESQSDGSQYQSAVTYQSRAYSERHPGGQNHYQSYSNYNPHYLPTYTPQATRYASQISLEEEQNATSSGTSQQRSQTPQYHPVSYPTATHAQSHQPQTATQMPSETATENPTQRWSAEFSPDERIRMGLRRYETEEEELRACTAVIQRVP